MGSVNDTSVLSQRLAQVFPAAKGAACLQAGNGNTYGRAGGGAH